MIVIPRGLAREFRAATRKCVVGRMRGPAPPMIVRSDGRRVILLVNLHEVSLAVEVTQSVIVTETIVVPPDVFEPIDGAEITLTADGFKGTARWEGRDGVRELPFEAIKPGRSHEMPTMPDVLLPVSATFLSALHECGRTTSREPSRFAMDRVRVDGTAGTVTATDAKQALICDRFQLPFDEAVLVPAVPVFGVKDFSAAGEVQVGRTKDHLVIRSGAWTVWLAIDTQGRFPDVASVIPKSREATVAGVDEKDAVDLLDALPVLPGAADELPVITLAVERGVRVRCKGEESEEIREVKLARSTFAGPPARIALDRRLLARALSLGCLSMRLIPGKPLVAEGAGRTFVVMTLDVSAAVPPSDGSTALAIPSPDHSDLERRRMPMKAHEANGHSQPARPDPTMNGAEGLDPFAEAEGLRAALAEVTARAGRLVQCLKQFRRQKRVLETAWSSLKSLGLGPGGGGS